MKKYKLPTFLENQVEVQLKKLGIGIAESKKISDAVLRMSDFYIQNPDAQTPWKESWCQVAQIAYYLPLNYLRAQYVCDEAYKLSFFDPNTNCIEVGYGLGALTLHLGEVFRKIQGIEVSQTAHSFFQDIIKSQNSVSFNQVKKLEVDDKSCVCFSYSLTEAISVNQLKLADSILIIEPSTHQDARSLQSLRQNLIDEGFYAWAPCTHQGQCPLLLHSQKDWCHHRIHIDMPDWFLGIEKHLPFKNKTLTLSYLLMSKRVPELSLPQRQKVRIIGDVLEEKGKSKALICRGEEREFFSILHRDSKEFPHERGDIAVLCGEIEKKGNELRLKG